MGILTKQSVSHLPQRLHFSDSMTGINLEIEAPEAHKAPIKHKLRQAQRRSNNNPSKTAPNVS